MASISLYIISFRKFLRRNTPIIAFVGVVFAGIALYWQLRTPQKPPSQTETKQEAPQTKNDQRQTLHQQSPPTNRPTKVVSEKAPEPQNPLTPQKTEPPTSIHATKSNVFSGTNTGNLNQTLNINEAPPEVRRGAKGFINSYDFNGVKRQIAPGRSIAIAGEEIAVFQNIVKLEKEKKYPELASLCKSQIEKTPDWLTPYLFLGIAAANMGLKTEAISNFEHVIENASGNPDYREAEKFVKLLKSSP